MKIGAQFYTIREFCQTPDDLAESLKKVADIGYKTVQISGTCKYDPQWLNERLKENGLKCVLTHTAPDRLINETQKVAEEHSVFDCDRVGLGAFGFDEEKEGQTFEDFIKIYTPVIETLSENGKYFMYHNHAHEFKKYNGKIYLEHLSERMPADKFGFTLDTYWVQVGGGDPAQWIEKLSGRVPCIHLKDYAHGQKMAVVGEGNINFDRVFQTAEKAGTEYMLVEQDDCYGENPFDCLKRSYEFLKSRGFE